MGAISARIDDACLGIVESTSDGSDDGCEGEDEQLVGLNRIAKEAHTGLIITDTAQDRAELAGDDPSAEDVAQT